jgi:hypothetical protein
VYRSAVISEVNNQVINLQVLDLKVFHEELTIDLVFFIKKTISYYNRYYNKKPTFKERDKIYLIRRNIQIKQLNTKLDHKKLVLFKIKKSYRTS